MQTVGDIALLITSDNSSSERRISPSWTVSQLKAKLEPVTGIPPLSQRLTLRVPGQQGLPVEAADEESTQLSGFPLAPYAELHVSVSCVGIISEMLYHVRRDPSSIVLLQPGLRRLKERVLTFPRWRMLGPLAPVPTSRMPRAWRNM